MFAVQLVAFLWWSTTLYNRYALSWDYHNIANALYQINHSSLKEGISVIAAHYGALIFWPIAQLVRLPPHDLWLLWIQDVTTVGASVVAFNWACELLQDRKSLGLASRRSLACLALLVLVANPWIFQGVSFDFHPESIGVFFIVLAARDVERGRTRRSLWWILLTLSAGFVTAAYVAGLAVTVVVAGRGRQRLFGVALLAAGLVGVFVASSGSGVFVGTYAYLASLPPGNPTTMTVVTGIILHPAKALGVLWATRGDFWANVLPVGGVGIFWRWGFGVPVLVLLLNLLQTNPILREPTFQNLAVYPFVAVGTVVVVAWLWERGCRLRLAAVSLGGIVGLLAIGWAVVWTPQIPSRWLRVSPQAAKVLAHLKAQIPVQDEVIASQGFIGRFASRLNAHALEDSTVSEPVETRHVWVIVGPAQGVETMPVNTQFALITEMAHEPGARLVASDDGIWAYDWTPPPGTNTLSIPAAVRTIGAWSLPSPAGTDQTVGPPSTWAAVSDGHIGYVVAGDYWREGVGTYEAKVVLATSGRTLVEVWNDTGNTLIERVTVPPTIGWTAVPLSFQISRLFPHKSVYQGWGPFTAPAISPPQGNRIEVRVWASATSEVSVRTVTLAQTEPNA